MKKNLLKVFIISSILAGLFCSCNMDGIEDTTYRDPLNVKSGQSNTIIISVPAISNKTEYITIYRFLNNTTKAKQTDKGTPIGVIYPKNYKGAGSFTFEDCYAVKDNTYVYRARYYTAEDDTALTKWSDEITSSNGLTSALKYPESNFSYNSVSYTLKLSKFDKNGAANTGLTVLKDADNRELLPMFVFASESGSQAILFPQDKWLNDKEIDLRTLLPSTFFDQNITITGMIGVREITEGTGNKKVTLQAVLTEPVELTVTGGTINIPSKSGQGGVDYS